MVVAILDLLGDAANVRLRTYGSKDELIRAYLQARSENWQKTVAEVLPARWENPRERILGIFTLMSEWFATPGYNGCPFINASAEAAAGEAVSEVRDQHRAWVRELFVGLAREAGATDPDALTAQLVLLYDGSMRLPASVLHPISVIQKGLAACAWIAIRLLRRTRE